MLHMAFHAPGPHALPAHHGFVHPEPHKVTLNYSAPCALSYLCPLLCPLAKCIGLALNHGSLPLISVQLLSFIQR